MRKTIGKGTKRAPLVSKDEASLNRRCLTLANFVLLGGDDGDMGTDLLPHATSSKPPLTPSANHPGQSHNTINQRQHSQCSSWIQKTGKMFISNNL
jgi:hypothetical protein